MALGVPASTYEWWGEGTQHSVRAVAVRVLGIQPACPRRAPSIPRAHDSSQTHAPPFPAPEGELRAKTRYYSAWPAIEASMVTPWGPRLKETSAWKLRFLRLQALPSHTILKVQLGQNVNRLGIYQTIRLLFTP